MTALILVDPQYDFMPGGALPAPGGDEVPAVANALMGRFELVVATQDWHPPEHLSFAGNHPGKKPGDVIDLDGVRQVLWPDHCVQGSPGAEFHRDLDVARIDRVVRKGTDPRVDSYSGFFDNARRRATGLEDDLRRRGVDEVVVMGLATEYCVKFTALDAVDLGFRTRLHAAGCRAIEQRPGDAERALAEMSAAGVGAFEP